MLFPRERMQLLMILLLGASSYAFYQLGLPEVAYINGILCGLTMVTSAITILLGLPLPPSLTKSEQGDLWLQQTYGLRDRKPRRTGSGRSIGKD